MKEKQKLINEFKSKREKIVAENKERKRRGESLLAVPEERKDL